MLKQRSELHFARDTHGLIRCFKNLQTTTEREKLLVIGKPLLITNLWTEFQKLSPNPKIFSKRCFWGGGSKSSIWTLKSTFSHIFDSFLKILSADSWSVKNFGLECTNSIFSQLKNWKMVNFGFLGIFF